MKAIVQEEYEITEEEKEIILKFREASKEAQLKVLELLKVKK